MPRRPLNPSTEAEYRSTLLHCFGAAEPQTFHLKADLSKISKARMDVVRAATTWACKRQGIDPVHALSALPEVEWRPQEAIEIPTAEEMLELEEKASHLPPGKRAAALLPLHMGLRASEVITLRRDWVERAFDRGELKVMRKGGKEQFLPAKHAKDLFEELLRAPKALPRKNLEQQMAELRSHGAALKRPGGDWTTVGQIISTGPKEAQYAALYAAIHRLGESVKMDLHPHKLRHVFATRMIKKGASLPLVQWMLGHVSPATTGRYIHPDASDVSKYL